MKPRTVLLGIVTLLLIGAQSALQAQSAKRQVAIALVDTLSQPGLRAEILRFSDPRRSDVILLPRAQVTAEDLAAAIATYRASVHRTPSRPGLVGRTGITAHDARGTRSPALRAAAARMLADVRRAPFGRIGNFGRGQWTSVAVAVRE